jgi:hypothetical protein
VNARPFRSVLVVLAAIGGLAACNSTPSARRVALDVIETLPVSDEVKECMRTKVEEDYSQDEIQAFAEGSDETPQDPEAKAALDRFEADLADCNTSS